MKKVKRAEGGGGRVLSNWYLNLTGKCNFRRRVCVKEDQQKWPVVLVELVPQIVREMQFALNLGMIETPFCVCFYFLEP